MLHPGHAPHAQEVLSWWTPRPFVLGLLIVGTGLYVRGLLRARPERGIGPWACAAAVGAIVLAIVSPIDRLSELYFSVHMGQHELLMIVAAPMIVIGRPLATVLFGLPSTWRSEVGRALGQPAVKAGWRALTHPLLVLFLHAVALWVWHIPVLFEAALRSDAVHTVEHLCFFGTACLFWWAVVHGRYGRAGYGVSVAYVFVTALHSSVLGALLSVADRPWYALYARRAETIGGDAMEDQQLAGLIMWVPAGLIFLVVGLALFAAWLGAAEHARRRRQYMPGTIL
jgi:putative membrane protein